MALSQRLSGKVAVITGGASGIGRECVRRFVAEGAKVFMADLNTHSGESLVEELRQQGGELEFLYTDVSDQQANKKLVNEATQRFGKIDICVCSAGIGSPPDPIYDLEVGDFDRVMAVNLRAPFMLGQLVARQMLEQSIAGSIINMSSVGSVLAVAEASAYCISKAGLGMLTKVMAVTLGPHNIRVNAIGPGTTETPMTAPGLALPQVQTLMRQRTPLGRTAKPEEMAAIAAFLASDEASYITGQTIYADGGRLALNYTMPVDGENTQK